MVKGIFFDISGVLLDGDNLIENADRALERVRQHDIPYRLITNTSRQTRAMLAGHLNGAGISVTEEEIYTAPLAARDYVIEHELRPYCLIHPDLTPEFADLDQTDPNAVVMGDAADDLNYENLNRAFRLCMEGATLIAIGHNKYFKRSGQFYLDAGPFVEAIEYACDIEAVITGKPAATFFDQVLNSIKLEAPDVLVIGDDIYGDIKGAQEAGLQSILVQTGKYRAGDELKLQPHPVVAKDVWQALRDL